jgi:XapX domain-containing protein
LLLKLALILDFWQRLSSGDALSLGKLEYLIMREFILSLVAGWIVGVLFGWLKLPLPAPPLMGFVGALGILLGAWSIEQLKQILLN